MGFAQRLENGNTLIIWGSVNPTVTEVKPDGTRALVMNLPSGVFSYRVFKYNYGNNITGYEPESNKIPSQFSLRQNYPNPFNPSTTIEFDVPELTGVKIDVCNSIGQIVSTIINDRLKAGSYKAEFNASGLSSGIYFYRMLTENNSIIKKMVLIK